MTTYALSRISPAMRKVLDVACIVWLTMLVIKLRRNATFPALDHPRGAKR
jgi:hypothetical protein